MNKIQIVKGCEGLAIYLNEHRIAGSKPWGIGTIISSWDATDEDIKEALNLKVKSDDKSQSSN